MTSAVTEDTKTDVFIPSAAADDTETDDLMSSARADDTKTHALLRFAAAHDTKADDLAQSMQKTVLKYLLWHSVCHYILKQNYL